MTPADNVLPKLEAVRDFGHGRGVARCPAHDDKNPSLAWTVREDGTLLLYCRAGCTTYDVVDAIGLKLRDLFAGGHIDRRQLEHRIDYKQALAILPLEATVITLAADHVVRGVPLTHDDLARVQIAANRIRDTVQATRMRR